jgi:hypothetical protein
LGNTLPFETHPQALTGVLRKKLSLLNIWDHRCVLLDPALEFVFSFYSLEGLKVASKWFWISIPISLWREKSLGVFVFFFFFKWCWGLTSRLHTC